MADEYVTRKTLLQRACDPDDARAWEEFVEYYRNFILMLLRYMRVNPADMLKRELFDYLRAVGQQVPQQAKE